MQSLEQFITEQGIKFECHAVNDRPDGLMQETRMYHYRVRILHDRRGFGLYFSQGTGITREPELADVLDCLASDAAGYENAQGFEDWASEYGYDVDSRKAEKVYRAVRRQAEQLKRTLGDENYETLLWQTERK